MQHFLQWWVHRGPLLSFPPVSSILPVVSDMRKWGRDRLPVLRNNSPNQSTELTLKMLSGESVEPKTFSDCCKSPLPCCMQFKQTHQGLLGAGGRAGGR